MISKVSTELGGMVRASDACMLLQSEEQVIKVKSRSKIAAVPTCSSNDDFAIVMHHGQQQSVYPRC